MNKDKILYLECGMGAAGDMLGAALYELLDEADRRKYLEEIGSAGIEGVRVEAKPVTRAGIAGTHMSVLIDGEEESEEMHEHHHHDHDHEHDHEHEHHPHDHDEHDHDHEDHSHCDHEHGVCHCGEDHHHHHADEVFDSIGLETSRKYTREVIEAALTELDENSKFGIILRAKGIVAGEDGQWIHFDYVPGEVSVRTGASDVTGKICVIGSEVKKDAVKALFGI